MIILLSSAKTFSKVFHSFATNPIFDKDALNIATKLAGLTAPQLAKQMKLSDKLSNTVFQYYHNFNKHLTCAIFAYNGYAYRSFDVLSFKKDSLDYLKNRLYILSGLYGLVRPFDGISFYRLEMQNTTIRNLYPFWSDKINSYLKENHKDQWLINLASNEFSKIIDNTHKLLTISFYELIDNKLKINSMQVKKMRGLMARHLIVNKVDDIEGIKKIELNGYYYNKARSTKTNYIFLKND